MITVDCITASNLLADGKIIIYPTESIFGIGCDPWNEKSVKKIYKIKGRPLNKPMIIIGTDLIQMKRLIDIDSITSTVKNTWPGHTTWLIPSKVDCPEWLKDNASGRVAVRISNHQVVKRICEEFSMPLISTSANKSNYKPSKDRKDVESIFTSEIDYIVEGDLGGNEDPSIIKDMLTGVIIRG